MFKPLPEDFLPDDSLDPFLFEPKPYVSPTAAEIDSQKLRTSWDGKNHGSVMASLDGAIYFAVAVLVVLTCQ